MRSFPLRWITLLLASAAVNPVMADTLQMPESSSQTTNISESGTLPERGMNMQQVKATFGEPKHVNAPVGEPPITRWDYSGYSVYFEGHYVIHSVKHR